MFGKPYCKAKLQNKGTVALIGISLLLLTLVLIKLPSKAEEASVSDRPLIDFAERAFDLGEVKEGTEVHHTFTVTNRGGKTLTIDRVSSSCGCTVPSMKIKNIEPGASAPLEVMMDTAMKQGKVTKDIEVYSNDPKSPKSIIQLTVTVQNLHAGLSNEQRAKIFEGRCAVCHVQVGLGLTGGDLYGADCAMCHGNKAQGAVGPALVPRDYADPAVYGYMEKITSYGSKSHASMPGFLMAAGGPLTGEDIKSILQFLKEQSQRK
ncbi:MAG: DUF1573 domain-containing protein [Candidatus Obscuribacterales bacterium]|nr:DUF1573 domain-containing protein [Candidatus Obscuribacterales bacterium]